MDNKAISREMQKVASLISNKKLASKESAFAEAMTRFLIGDRSSALKLMKQLKNVNIEGDVATLSTEGYNKLFSNLTSDLMKAIKENIPV